MRRISADYIFPVSSPPIKNGVVEVDEEGFILEISSPSERSPSDKSQVPGNTEKYQGIIVPGFVNAHCHLELSHMKGKVSENKGLTGFISELVPQRDKTPVEEIRSAIEKAEEEMINNGIVAVGDISNTDHSFDQKQKGRLAYYTFLEAFDLSEGKAKEKFLEAKLLSMKLEKQKNAIVPHAPYTVSAKLMEMIDNLKQPLISIHNQESASENELFLSGTGPLAEMLQKAGVDIDLKRRAKGSLLFTFGGLMESRKILLVHNTYTSKEDIELIKFYQEGSEYEVALCLCPRANIYIENRLPDISLFVNEGMKLVIGTDSYASNWSLSVLDELKIISRHLPQIALETLIAWGTKNGAEFLQMEKEFGTIEKGKRPGLNLLTGVDLNTLQLSDTSSVQKLI